MGRNAGILLSHNPAAEPGHSFTSVSLLPRQHLGWVLLVDARTHMHTHARCFTHSCIYTYICTCLHINLNMHAHVSATCYVWLWTYPYTQMYMAVANSAEKGELMYAVETLTALSVCGRYTKCSLPLVSSLRPKTNLQLSPFIHNSCCLVHLFWKTSRQACPLPAFFSSSRQK